MNTDGRKKGAHSVTPKQIFINLKNENVIKCDKNNLKFTINLTIKFEGSVPHVHQSFLSICTLV